MNKQAKNDIESKEFIKQAEENLSLFLDNENEDVKEFNNELVDILSGHYSSGKTRC